ncbi:unnamed protein product [Musa acuminata subsp. burmannicoides]
MLLLLVLWSVYVKYLFQLLWYSDFMSLGHKAYLLSRRLQVQQIEPKPMLPLVASSSVYWVPQEKSGFDVRCGRVSILGYDFCSSECNCS